MKKQFGNTWWGKQWLMALEHADYSNRLPRGKNYARDGAVAKLELIGSEIVAQVWGSRPRPYQVVLECGTFSKRAVHDFMEKLAQHPSILEKLLHRELDPRVLDLAKEAGLSLFPSSMQDMGMHCNCPDWAHLCKHIAAVVYQVSLEIDNNPFFVFSMHGMSLLEEMEKRGAHLSSSVEVQIPEWKNWIEGKPFPKVIPPVKEPLSLVNPDFTKMRSLFPVWMKVLPEAPAFYNLGDFRKVYEKAMGQVQKQAAYGLYDSEKIYGIGSGHDSEILSRASDAGLIIRGLKEGDAIVGRERWALSRFLSALVDMTEEEVEESDFTVRAFRQAALLSMHVLIRGNVIPELVSLGQNRYGIRWLPVDMDPGTAAAMGQLASWISSFTVCYKDYNDDSMMVRHPVEAVVSLFLSHWLPHLLKPNFKEDWVYDLFFHGDIFGSQEIDSEDQWTGIAVWLSHFHLTSCRWQPVLYLSDTNDGKTFSLDIAVRDGEEADGAEISLADVCTKKTYEANRYDILKDMDLLSSLIDGMSAYMDGKGQHPISFTHENLAPFLLTVLPAMRLLGAQVVLPKSLAHLIRPKRTIRIKKKEGEKARTHSAIHLEDMLDFDWQIALGEDRISPEEFEKLAVKAGSLIRFKGNYIYVTEEDIKQLEQMWRLTSSMKPEKLLRLALMESYEGTKISIDPEIREKIQEMKQISSVPLPEHIQATLRPYQERGYSWMYQNSRLGFGSILADDMGLGKTLQAITLLEKFREEGRLQKEKALVVVPTSLLMNWQEEIHRFAPDLSVSLYYGPSRNLKDCHGDVLLTSYGMLRSDEEILKKKKWGVFIIDEAQNIKNPDTAQSRAVRSMKAKTRIALSGTPVENNLKEFWSIMDFANKGYLGTVKSFKTEYADPIQYEQDQEKAEEFRQFTSPMLLRRLKSDKSIISDLPDKIEQDTYAMLTPAQAALYDKTVEESLRVIESASKDGSGSIFKRQGLVLQMILALKEICNHPALFMKDGNWDPALSGKAEMLLDLASSIAANHEKALIFTQFRDMGDKLADFLEKKLGERPMFLHGGCSLKDRKAMVDRFQTDPKARFFILSLKAAGTGLNLTAASHVIHYDLWWNPAVESQATDRAYRIGQKNNVVVHRFITKNTFEEKINEILKQKKVLADMTVAIGENWIGNMDDKELRKIFGN